MPRNFFVHLLHVPQDVNVRIEYDGRELPASSQAGSVDVSFWIAPDTVVSIILIKEDAGLASSQYLVHEGVIYEAKSLSESIPLYQVVYML